MAVFSFDYNARFAVCRHFVGIYFYVNIRTVEIIGDRVHEEHAFGAAIIVVKRCEILGVCFCREKFGLCYYTSFQWICYADFDFQV